MRRSSTRCRRQRRADRALPCAVPPGSGAAGSTALFPGGRRAEARNTLREQIGYALFAHTGMRVHPHLFRHIGAKLFLDANPGSYEVMRRVLGTARSRRRRLSTPAWKWWPRFATSMPPSSSCARPEAGREPAALRSRTARHAGRGMAGGRSRGLAGRPLPAISWTRAASSRPLCAGHEPQLAKNYGRWLTWLCRRGLLDDHTPPAERITPERVTAFVADIANQRHGTILARLQALYEMAEGPRWRPRLADPPDRLADPRPAPAGRARSATAWSALPTYWRWDAR